MDGLWPKGSIKWGHKDQSKTQYGLSLSPGSIIPALVTSALPFPPGFVLQMPEPKLTLDSGSKVRGSQEIDLSQYPTLILALDKPVGKKLPWSRYLRLIQNRASKAHVLAVHLKPPKILDFGETTMSSLDSSIGSIILVAVTLELLSEITSDLGIQGTCAGSAFKSPSDSGLWGNYVDSTDLNIDLAAIQPPL